MSDPIVQGGRERNTSRRGFWDQLGEAILLGAKASQESRPDSTGGLLEALMLNPAVTSVKFERHDMPQDTPAFPYRHVSFEVVADGVKFGLQSSEPLSGSSVVKPASLQVVVAKVSQSIRDHQARAGGE